MRRAPIPPQQAGCEPGRRDADSRQHRSEASWPDRARARRRDHQEHRRQPYLCRGAGSLMTVPPTKEGALTERVARVLLGAPWGIDPVKGQVSFGDIGVNIPPGRFFDFEDETAG